LDGSEGKDADQKGARAVGTTLTPEFWERFAVLLVAAMSVTFILTAALDALAVRVLRRRADRSRPTSSPTPPRRATADHRMSAHC
jgi:hypothetical protein